MRNERLFAEGNRTVDSLTHQPAPSVCSGLIASYIYIYIYIYIHRVSQEECARLREGVPYVKIYRYNPKHLCSKLNGYGDNGQRSLKIRTYQHPSIDRGADKSLARPTSRCILFDFENISFDASLVLYIYIYIYK